MYDPVIGRMLSPDDRADVPAATQSYNKFSYALNNPLKYTDPTGWSTEDGQDDNTNGLDDMRNNLNDYDESPYGPQNDLFSGTGSGGAPEGDNAVSG